MSHRPKNSVASYISIRASVRRRANMHTSRTKTKTQPETYEHEWIILCQSTMHSNTSIDLMCSRTTYRKQIYLRTAAHTARIQIEFEWGSSRIHVHHSKSYLLPTCKCVNVNNNINNLMLFLRPNFLLTVAINEMKFQWKFAVPSNMYVCTI